MADASIEERLDRVEKELRETRKEMLEGFARVPTREELGERLHQFATREELDKRLAQFATREELERLVREEGATTRRHFDVVYEKFAQDVRLLGEAHETLRQRVDRLAQRQGPPRRRQE